MLFSSYKIRNMELKNRWIMLAMHTGFAESNALGERDFAFYEQRAKGGAAAVTCLLAVNEAGALKGMYHADTVDAESLKTLAERVHDHDCKLIVQLFHCGRNESEKNHGERELLAPSAEPSPLFKAEPKEMTEDDLKNTKADFAKAAALCKEIGADAVEVSASAGYLLSEFFSPLSNLREDAYGVKEEMGTKYPLEVLASVREAVGDFPILVKVSASQMVEGGYDLDSTLTFCRAAKAAGTVDAVTVTGGWHESPVEQISYHVEKGAYAPFAGLVKKFTELPVIACNRIQDKETGERILKQGLCDFCGSARAFLADPYFVEKMKANVEFQPCLGCNRCIAGVLKGEELGCAYRPETGNEFFENQRRRIASRKAIVVVGGGPAGLEAAKKSAERGYKTTLVCQEKELGGQFRFAGMAPKKGDYAKYIHYMETMLNMLDVEIVRETTADVEFVKARDPYFVVLATGSCHEKHPIEGWSNENYFTVPEIFSMDEKKLDELLKGEIVILGGSALGLETAAYLADKAEEPEIKIIEKGAKMGAEMGAMARPLTQELRKKNVSFLTTTEVKAAEGNKIYVKVGEMPFFVKADTVIWAGQPESVTPSDIMLWLMDERISYGLIGDAENVADGGAAVADAYELFTRLYLA